MKTINQSNVLALSKEYIPKTVPKTAQVFGKVLLGENLTFMPAYCSVPNSILCLTQVVSTQE
jgi:hypothetical protein